MEGSLREVEKFSKNGVEVDKKRYLSHNKGGEGGEIYINVLGHHKSFYECHREIYLERKIHTLQAGARGKGERQVEGVLDWVAAYIGMRNRTGVKKLLGGG